MFFSGVKGISPCKRSVYTQTLLADILLSPYGEQYIRLLSYKVNDYLPLILLLKLITIRLSGNAPKHS